MEIEDLILEEPDYFRQIKVKMYHQFQKYN